MYFNLSLTLKDSIYNLGSSFKCIMTFSICFLFLKARNVGIEVLNLSWNHLRMRGAIALSAGLKVTNTLKLKPLVYIWRPVSYHSCLSLSFSFLQVNSTLKQLQLSRNGFGHIEAESLGQALKQNSTLQLLDLSSNCMDDQAVTLLCQGLATNDTLRVLKVSGQKGCELVVFFVVFDQRHGELKRLHSVDQLMLNIRFGVCTFCSALP